MDEAGQRIIDKLWRGSLPADEPVKTWGGFGSGLACDGCDHVLGSNEPEHEEEMPDGGTLRFHVASAGAGGS